MEIFFADVFVDANQLLKNNATCPYIHVSYGVGVTTATLTRIRLWREVVA